MAQSRRRSSRTQATRRRSRGPGRPGRLRRLALGLVLTAFLGGFIAGSWVVRLDRIVTARFDGQRFRVPSRVFAAPAILYPGLDWKLIELRETMQRLGYREARGTRDLPPGQYVWGPSRVRVHLRAFEHPSRHEPSRDVVFRLNGDLIDEIRELPGGSELGAVLLEPEQLGAYYGPEHQQRQLVTLDDVPRHLVDAILAVEDQRFETHPGVDLQRIVGAALANLRAGSIRQGGSTLTQQLVKNFFLTPERTLRRKVQEAVMSLLVELRYDKRSILQSYLNEIYLGQRGATAVHGVGEAARLYFGKTANELSVAESALIAAIIQSPNGLSPYRDGERAIRRRNLVLDLMRDQGRIGDKLHSRARSESLQIATVTPDAADARYFLDLVRRRLPEMYDLEALRSEGLRIYSTLDGRLQRLAGIALREGLARLEARNPALKTDDRSRQLQGCIIAMRPQTGELLAMVGGRDYGVSQFDRCTQARRQVGSVFKPFVYVAALEPTRGAPAITLASFLDDSPLEIDTPSGPWRPDNYDGEFHGIVPVREALERSLNVATARLADRLTAVRIAEVARRLGITSPLPLVPSLALGSADLSPIEILRAYATIASGGIRPESQVIEDLVDAQGNTLERRRLRFDRVLDPGTAYLVTSLLVGVAERGTAAGVRNSGLRGPIAAKTGTTDGERDLWFVGFTPELVAAVWIGFDEPRSVGVPSSVGALPIWRRFVQEATGGEIRGKFLPPPGIEQVEVDPATGALALAGCAERRTEYFIRGTLPVEVCPRGFRGAVESDSPGTQSEFFEWLRKRL